MYKIAVLLTTYNSQSFIEEQLKSILNQEKVNVTIFISDDFSKDNTLDIAKKIIPKEKLIILNNDKPFGKPGLNFFSLVERVYDEIFDYYCFADHDDIWNIEKLIRGVELIIKTNAKGYSSSFHSFYENNKPKKYISKHPIQRRIDHIFSSPGPGCTFILEKNSYNILRQKFIQKREIFLNCEYHDWAIYAFYRAMCIPWVIDDRSFIDYRQHSANDTGANSGVKAYKKRLRLFINRAYESQVAAIARLVNEFNPKVTTEICTLNKLQYYYLLLKESRRSYKDRLILLIISIFALLRKKIIFQT